ncbi:MAG: ATP-dependent DNA helicase UvrD2 [Actinomycetota bacterium]
MIGCGHCGGQHATVAEVRACSAGTPAVSAPPGSEPLPEPDPPARPRRGVATAPAVSPVVLAADWERLAGPEGLARNLIVRPGDAVPAPWADAGRVAVSDVDDPIAIDDLRAARTARRRVVIELGCDLPAPDPVLDIDYWHLSPEADLEGEVLRHLVLSHAVDAREPERPTVDAISRAIAAGATLTTEGPGDVTTAHGVAWCDGGPLDWLELDAPLIPAVHLASGSVDTLGHADPSAELAPDQLAAVSHRGGGARIIAPAGSGKTRVLTERARHLVRDRGVDPSTICMVAFNVRARAEMEERTTDLPGLEIRTLNSLALAILSGRAPFAPPARRRAPSVVDERDVRRILDDLVSTRRQAMSDPFATWIEALTATRLGLRSPAAVEQEFAPDVTGFADVLPQYRDRLANAGAVDFDEQILGAIEVLCTDPAARAAARRVCGVLLVDEFQDLTPAHVLLLRLLAGPAAEVFGVGDDDQTIYGYSGASPSWLIDFADLFPGAAAHDLTVNYRCPPAVVEGAATLLTHNRRRIDKTIAAAPGRAGHTSDLAVAQSDDALAVTLARVRDLVGTGTRPRDIAVLTRVNSTLLGPMLLLEEDGIPTNAPVHANFLERTGVAGALAWLDLATAPAQRFSGSAVETAIRRPPRGISARLAGWAGEQSSIKGLRALAGRMNNERDQQKVSGFADDLERLRAGAESGADTATLLAMIRDEVGLGQALDNRLDASRRSVDRSAHGDDLAALLAVASHQPDPGLFGDWISERLDRIEADPGGVRLATIHRVKGREWPHVIVHEATAGLMPHRLASDREEERRVFHVAVTRGSEDVLVAAGTPPSPFVAQLTVERDPDAEPEPELRPRAAEASAGRKPRAKREVPEASSITEASLRESLRTWRTKRAKDDAVPAYVVFNDTTLFELARLRPTDENALLDITGIGPVKIEKYGAEIIALVEDALQDG